MAKINRRTIGSRYEEIAAEFLIRHGHEILEKNYYTRYGEIDLVARYKGYLVFAEVKYRRGSWDGAAAEAVSQKKQQTIRRVAQCYMLEHGHDIDLPCRFDVIAIEDRRLRWIPNAF